MKIAVTGSSGFVGSQLVQQLKKAGHQIFSLDIASGIDLTNWNEVKKTPAIDCVFHLAAKTFVPAAFKNPQSFYHTNLISTLNALELCRRDSAKFIYASSYVYGAPKYLPVDEEHPTGAHNPYAQSKLMGEDLCKAYWRDFSISSCIIRPFNIYGPGQPSSFLIPEIIRQAQAGNICLKDPRPKRDFIYIDDVISAYMACLNFSEQGVTAFNIGSGKSFSVKEIAQMIAKQFKSTTLSFLNEHRPNEVLDTVADISKAKKLLNWNPLTKLKDGLNLCL